MKLLDGVTADATLSPCGTYRYLLTRHWYGGAKARHVLFIMLNPSTADADTDDATIRKCIKYARAWGYAGITVANLFALRSRDPAVLKRHPDPIGPANDDILTALATASGIGLVVGAWGQHGALRNRGLIVGQMLADAGATVHRLGEPTKGGHPWHPLYRLDDIDLQVHAFPLLGHAVKKP